MTFGLCIEVLWASDTDTGPGGVFCPLAEKIATLLLYQLPGKHNISLYSRRVFPDINSLQDDVNETRHDSSVSAKGGTLLY